MKNVKTGIILILSIAALSCETPVTPSFPNDGQQTVIYSFFGPDTPIHIDAFNTVSILERPTFDRASDLSISLFEDGIPLETLSASTTGYTSLSSAEEGKTYRLEALVGDQLLTAEGIIPEQVSIISTTIDQTIRQINLGEFGYPAHVTFLDPEESINYYMIEVFVDDCADGCREDDIAGTLNELLVEDVKVDPSGNTDIHIGGDPADIEGDPYLYFSDNEFNGQQFTFDFYLVPSLISIENPQEAVVKFVLKNISADYYQYLLTTDYQRQIEEEGTTAEPVQIHTNVQGGLGLFAGYNLAMATVRVN